MGRGGVGWVWVGWVWVGRGEVVKAGRGGVGGAGFCVCVAWCCAMWACVGALWGGVGLRRRQRFGPPPWPLVKWMHRFDRSVVNPF